MTSHISEWLSSINQQTTSAGEDAEKREFSSTVGVSVDWCSHCGKHVWHYLKNSRMELLYDPEIPLLRVYLKKTEILI